MYKRQAYFTASLLLTLSLLAVCMVICTVFMEEIAWMLGGTEETMPYIMGYLPYIVWGMGAFFFSSYLQTFVRNDGAPKLAMNGVIAGGVTNIILDYVFVFPMDMGIYTNSCRTISSARLRILFIRRTHSI